MMLNQCFIDKHLSCYFCLLSSVYFTFDHLILAKIFNNLENIMAPLWQGLLPQLTGSNDFIYDKMAAAS